MHAQVVTGRSVRRELVDLTPKLAAELLAKNSGNRPVSRRRVARIAQEILDGGWKFNGQPIIRDADDALLDGQHRCLAVVMAQRSVPTLLVSGVERAAFATIDSGRARSAGDVLAAGGHTQGSRLAAVLRLVYQHELGVLGSTKIEHQPTNADIESIVGEYPDARDAILWAKNLSHLRVSPIIFLYWATMRANRDMAVEFWDGVKSGVGLSRGSPALRLRDMLLSNARSRSKLIHSDILDRGARAWTNFMAGHSAEALRGGLIAEGFRIPATKAQAEALIRDAIRNLRNHSRKSA